MSQNDLTDLSIAEAAALIVRRQVSPSELTNAYLARIEEQNPLLNAYVTVTTEAARAAAKVADEEIAHGTYRGPLHGIPIALKDLYATKGVRTAAGSKILWDRVPGADATVTRLLREAGAIALGKTNTHEFAFGVTTNNPHFGATRNPWNPDCIPGGSSGGSGAAVAAGMATMAMGTDTGGSIRIPAALCGTVGLKATHGRVSTAGVIPLSWTLDHAGPTHPHHRGCRDCPQRHRGRRPERHDDRPNTCRRLPKRPRCRRPGIAIRRAVRRAVRSARCRGLRRA